MDRRPVPRRLGAGPHLPLRPAAGAPRLLHRRVLLRRRQGHRVLPQRRRLLLGDRAHHLLGQRVLHGALPDARCHGDPLFAPRGGQGVGVRPDGREPHLAHHLVGDPRRGDLDPPQPGHQPGRRVVPAKQLGAAGHGDQQRHRLARPRRHLWRPAPPARAARHDVVPDHGHQPRLPPHRRPHAARVRLAPLLALRARPKVVQDGALAALLLDAPRV
mmetsp:Transcript_20283/g.60793  ORF Transcript_20283/g.60793 Transcript_20283/m.60793 type:complete len:216 (+) Transcript_20283:1961-2608(+)